MSEDFNTKTLKLANSLKNLGHGDRRHYAQENTELKVVKIGCEEDDDWDNIIWYLLERPYGDFEFKEVSSYNESELSDLAFEILKYAGTKC